MSRGISLHIGVNKLDPNFYRNTTFKNLKSCVNDATEMMRLAKLKGFEALPVLADAKKNDVKNIIREIANELVSGDICLITFSGHGGQIRDANRDERFDRFFLDETWCFFDKPMSDDEILDLWTDFKEGVRILIIPDSCHSGGIIDFFKLGINNQIYSSLLAKGFDFKSFEIQLLAENGFDFLHLDTSKWDDNSKILDEMDLSGRLRADFSKRKNDLLKQQVKTIPRQILEHLCLVENKEEYKEDQQAAKRSLLNKLNHSNARHVQELKRSSLILISACEDWQTTKDGASENDNGDFTKALLSAFKDVNGEFLPGYENFRLLLINKLESMQKTQKPRFFPTGKPNERFEKQSPFTI